MNHLVIGLSDKTECLLQLAKPPFLLIDDGPIADTFLEQFDAEQFDYTRHSFDPLSGTDYPRATDFVETLRAAFPAGENTLTREEADIVLLEALLAKPKSLATLVHPTKDDPATRKAHRMIERLLLSPVLNKVLCQPTNFSFKSKTWKCIVARIDRAALRDFDALVLGNFLIGQYQGQVIVPDFGFYGRPFHTSLIRQTRLIAGLNYLAELPVKLQQAVLSIRDKTAYRTTLEDAERLKVYFQVTNASQLADQGDGECLRTRTPR